MHISWPEISAFHVVRRTLDKYPELMGGRNVVRYRGKVKLHGTNAAVQVRKGGNPNVIAQSRERILGSGNDNCGFRAWVDTVRDKFLAIDVEDAIIFGEWCGPGIMKGVAVSQIPEKIFAVFAAQPLDDLERLIVEPHSLELFVAGIPNVYVIPWIGEDIEVPWLETSDVLEPITEAINVRVAEIDALDPWIKETFNVEGPGEGIVFYPISHPSRKHFKNLAFKAKGEEHKVVTKTKSAQVDPTVVENVKAFAEMVVSEARCEQATRAASGGELTFDPRLIGPFLKWINQDINKECVAELEASGLDRKLVGQAVQSRAREWYIAQSRKL